VLGFATIGGAMASACGAAAIVALAPNQVRAQATAVCWVIINLAGLFIGPPLVGLITDRVFGDPAALRYGLAIVPFLAGVPLIFVQLRALQAFRREMGRLAGAPAGQ
jgi:MFS family permease